MEKIIKKNLAISLVIFIDPYQNIAHKMPCNAQLIEIFLFDFFLYEQEEIWKELSGKIEKWKLMKNSKTIFSIEINQDIIFYYYFIHQNYKYRKTNIWYSQLQQQRKKSIQYCNNGLHIKFY
jgi:hypothetical protein